MDRWSRRQFVQGVGLAGLALVAGCGGLPGQATAPRVARIGWLGASSKASGSGLEPFRQELRELGYLEAQNFVIEDRYSEGLDHRFPELARELVGLPVDIIVAQSTPAVQAARDASDTIPVVMLIAGDPVRAGLIASFGRPGGTITGVTSDISTRLIAKRLELLVETEPRVSRVATITQAGSYAGPLAIQTAQMAAQALGVELRSLQTHDPEELPSQFEAAAREGAQALIFLPAPMGPSAVADIVALAAKSRLPAMYVSRAYVDAGGLMSYGPNPAALQRRAAYYVDRILKGAKPADLPVEQPMTFDFIINLKTAQALGLTMPEHVLLQATEVIQ